MTPTATITETASAPAPAPPPRNPVAGAIEPFARNGYARLRDLDTPRLEDELRAMEAPHARFVARTRELWTEGFAHTGDKLDNWSRRWEYPYCWWNLRQGRPGRVLDAGSGITFFPYLMAEAGWTVSCADIVPELAPKFARANLLTGQSVEYAVAPIEHLGWSDEAFDSVVCVSVLEHAPRRLEAVAEFARVLKPGGRLVLTMDLSLSRDSDVKFEDLAVILAQLNEAFEPLYPLDLHRPTDLLTTDAMLASQRWRLSWKPSRNPLRRFASWLGRGNDFRSLAVLGSCWRKRA